MKRLVIVESPTKVKKIQQYLPAGFVVDSCVGHVRDLPSKRSEVPKAIQGEAWADYGVDVDNGFKPYYVTIQGKGKVITALKKKLADAEELWLATDEDREGESIAWHLVQALSPKVPVKRMVFNEITKKAVLDAVEHPRALDLDLVQAQETRRILDRLFGYSLSPLLWKKIGGNLSAGRVQSVAVRLIVQRERERRAFVTGSYWDLTAQLDHGGAFAARLAELDGMRVATGRDFDKDTGRLVAGSEAVLVEERAARDLAASLQDASWTVEGVDASPRRATPPAPFITSTLQQEANNRLGMSARRAMQVAQDLYQNGFITYMRTDSTALSEEGLEGARAAVRSEFGAEHLHATPRTYEGKKAKAAQEAHEAIRPAGEAFVHPDRSGLTGPAKDLYKLVWQRTLASQMADEEAILTTVRIAALEAVFIARGKTVVRPGFRLAWPTARDDDGPLPRLTAGDRPTLLDLVAEGHDTKPPARYTEATLVQALEKEGIGRPSTYAAILENILHRGYVERRGKALVPTFTGGAVTTFLERHFPNLVDPSFTARMEGTLDEIAGGDAAWQPFLAGFFLGDDGLRPRIKAKMDEVDALTAKDIDLGTPSRFAVRIGRYGAYVQGTVGGEDVRATIPQTLTLEELHDDVLERLLTQRQQGPDALGNDPVSGTPITVREGRYGPYYQLGDGQDVKRASLPKGKTPADADLDEALFLLSLPRGLGDHPDGGAVEANVGRYGPYVVWNKPDQTRDYRNLSNDDALRTVDLAQALALLAEAKRGRTRAGGVLRELGAHPDDGKPVQLLSGRYGPYVKHGKTNASIPRDRDAAAVTLEEAVALLAERRARS